MRLARTAARAVVAPVAARARIRKDGTSSWTSPSLRSWESTSPSGPSTCTCSPSEGRSSSNDSKGRRQLREQLPPPGLCLIVVEATGGYERALVVELIDAGYHVAVVNPRQAR